MNTSLPFAGDLFPELARLQQHLDEVFAGAPANIRAASRGAYPAINVGQSTDTVEVLAFAPGAEPASMQVTIDRGLLVIAGERRADSSNRGDGTNVYAQERFMGKFRRVVSLPADADPAQVQARFENGILHISVAKRESSKPRQISIN